ncbi:acyltransferase family protein [Pectobacterium versatile]|uniref:acyltransferase family protein n=1 Tax=Pectobacterium versatile TaxID=2488639 RepID=UPI003017D1CA
MHNNKFRKDINGLRAIAVILVVIFHFSRDFLNSGFVGVDVFFVISGFLMTSIIINGLKNNTFSILHFLKARTIRIVPALLFVIFLLLIFGYIFIEPMSYQLLGKHAADSLIFVSNFTYKSESGYFDLDTYSKFLLHTWSLSVEWQFYLIYPFLLLLFKRVFNGNYELIRRFVLLLCVLSFFYALYISFKRPVSAYYMLYARAWELLVGACVFLYPLNMDQGHRKKLEISGLLLIFISLFLIDAETKWPGYMALLPVFGAGLVISANSSKSILSNVILNKVGLWSYSIYLVHWPVIVFFKKLSIEIYLIPYLVFITLISFLMYEFIEKKRNFKYTFAMLYALTLILAFYVSYDGVKIRESNKKFQLTQKEFHLSYYGGIGYDGGAVQYLNSDKESFKTLFYGDSLAWQYAKYIDKSKHPSVSFFQNSCFSLPNAYVTGLDKEACKNQFSTVHDFISGYKEKNIVISQNWTASNITWLDMKGNEIKFKNASSYKDFLKKELSSFIHEMGEDKKYFIVGKTVAMETEDSFTCLARKNLPVYKIIKMECLSEQPNDQGEILAINMFLRDFSSQYKNVHFIDPNNALCQDNQCKLMINDEPVYSDKYHLSIYGADIVGPYIIDKIKKFGVN